MDINTCSLAAENIIATLSREKTIILATSANNLVTTRSISHVNDGMAIYFQTGGRYLKTRQIKVNPNVAIHIDGYDIVGKAVLLGHPLDKDNDMFFKLFKDKHPSYAEKWSAHPEEVVIRVDIEMVKKWLYIDGKPYIAVWKDKCYSHSYDT